MPLKLLEKQNGKSHTKVDVSRIEIHTRKVQVTTNIVPHNPQFHTATNLAL